MKTLLLIITFFYSFLGFAQEIQNNIQFINLEVFQSNKIGGHLKIEINLYDVKAKPTLKIYKGSDIHSNLLDNDVSELISAKKYAKIIEEIHKISLSAILSDFEEDVVGLDGVTTHLNFGKGWSSPDSVDFHFWSPDYKTEERGLTHYYEAIRLIILAADLDPKEYL